MKPLIRLLSDAVANQIAAGEVIQRPASVAKELLENALDAGSTDIKLAFKDAGSTLIHVIDNGHGMHQVDARLCIARHATSKIRAAQDLLALRTMGFRGEALASIAAIAQLVLTTRTASQPLGTCLTIEDSRIITQKAISTSVGTQISVKNIFWNVPVRRTFLKTPAVESKHILEEFYHIALSHPHIALSLYQDDKELYKLPAAKLHQRIVHLFGKSYQEQLIPCNAHTEHLQIKGYIGSPAQAKKTRGGQFFFVNKRYIKSSYLHHALKRTFQHLIPADTFPFYVLFIDLPADQVDVNIHPAKTEVRFQDAPLVYNVLAAAIKKGLAGHHSTPSLDFDHNVNQVRWAPTAPLASRIAQQRYTQFSHTLPTRQAVAAAQPIASAPTLVSEANQVPSLSLPSKHQRPLDTLGSKVQIHERYLICQVRSGMLLIDQQAARQRILYEKNLQRLAHASGTSQQLLFATLAKLHTDDLMLLQESKPILAS